MRQFENPPWQPGIKYANKVYEFMPTDTKESFDQLCAVPEYREYFRQQGWLEPGAITYSINSQGFRCDEFNNHDCMIALGCSFTFGTGLPIESTWPQLVGQQLGLIPYSLAWGGASADTCFRLAEYWIPALEPRAVFLLTPPPNRFELIRAAGHPPVEIYLPNSETGRLSEAENFHKHWFTMELNSQLNQKKNKLAIQAICANFDIPCFVYDVFDHMSWPQEVIGYARDRMHSGPIGHKMLAERMLDDWRKKHT